MQRSVPGLQQAGPLLLNLLKIKKFMHKKVQLPVGEPVGRLTCPRCGNTEEFVEVAANVQVTNHYRQNRDGSFSVVRSETEINGEVKLFCARCSTDLSDFHAHMQEMTF